MDEISKLPAMAETTSSDTQNQSMAKFVPGGGRQELPAPDKRVEKDEASVTTISSRAPEQEKISQGRPIDYRPQFCELVEALGGDGLSFTEIAVKIGVSRQILINWCDAHDDFSEAIKHAQEAEQAYFERVGREGMYMGKQFNASAWQFQMRHRFPEYYGDAKDVVVTTSPPQIRLIVSKDDMNL
jgi:hypothetical protein